MGYTDLDQLAINTIRVLAVSFRFLTLAAVLRRTFFLLLGVSVDAVFSYGGIVFFRQRKPSKLSQLLSTALLCSALEDDSTRI